MPAAAEATEVQSITLTLNGQDVQARPGQTILEVAREAGVDIPTLCYDPRLEPYGACRLCLVEVEGARGPMAACGTTVREGMKIETHSEKIVKLRKFVLELLLTNHPLDCPVCEAAGNCKLQDYAYEYLVDMVPWGWRAPEATSPGDHPNIAHFGTRCVLCGRCVRICREVMSIGCWGYLNRGYDSEVDTPYRMPLQEVGCVSCGQCVSTCPVGAITGQRTASGAREWQTTKVRTTCSYCASGCELLVHGHNKRVIRVASQVERGLNGGNLCVKGRFGLGYANAADRLTKPLIRNSSGEFMEVSWEEALQRVVMLTGDLARGQNGEVFAAIGGSHCTNEAAYLLQKLARTVFGSNNIDSTDAVSQRAVDEALIAAFGSSAATNTRKDLGAADVILIIGSNLTESNPVLALTVIKAIRQGKTVIVVDPRTTDLARRAKLHLALKPGSDLAVLRGLMAHILALELEDKDFIANRTVEFSALKTALKAVNVEDEAAAAGLDPQLLRAAAEAYARADAAALIFGSGVSQGPLAADAVRAIADLALLTGNVGRAGCGVYPVRYGANSQGIMDMGVRPDSLPGGFALDDSDARARLEEVWGSSLPQNKPGKTLPQIMDAVDAGDVRFVYIVGDDPALTLADEAAVRETLASIPFLIVQDSFLTDTAAYAHVVLPSSVSTEDEGTFTNGERCVQRVRPAAPSWGESRPDWQIIYEIAKRLGADWSYGSPADVMSEIGEVVAAYRGVSYDRIEDEGVFQPCLSADSPGEAILYSDGFARGKGMFAPVRTGTVSATTDETCPFVLITGSVREHHETGARTRRSPGLTQLMAEPRMEVNPEDAARLNLTDGGKAQVIAPSEASIDVRVAVTARVPEGIVFVPGFSAKSPLNRLLKRTADTLPTVGIERIG